MKLFEDLPVASECDSAPEQLSIFAAGFSCKWLADLLFIAC